MVKFTQGLFITNDKKMDVVVKTFVKNEEIEETLKTAVQSSNLNEELGQV